MKFIFGNFKAKLNKEQTLNILEQYANLNIINKKSGFCVLPDFFVEAKKVVKKKLNLVLQNATLRDIASLKAGLDKNDKLPQLLLGHSDYRNIGKEKNSLILKKVKLALDLGFQAILCVGESLIQKQKNRTRKVVLKEISGLKKQNLTNLIIAYEPIYSIGTGQIASQKDVEDVIDLIKNNLGSVPVLYGGSVNVKNVKNILEYKNCGGVLIGGVSLNYLEMAEIFKIANEI